jgi:hypothetical protein
VSPPETERPADREGDSAWGWEEQSRRQAMAGLELSPAERLRWLEQTNATMRRWLGRARGKGARGTIASD